MIQNKKLTDGPAASNFTEKAAEPERELKVVEELQQIKAHLNNEQARFFITCAINAIISRESYKVAQKNEILTYLQTLESQGIIKFGLTTCARCHTKLLPTDTAFMSWTPGKGSEILCEKCNSWEGYNGH